MQTESLTGQINFYPRPPRGGRQPEQYPKYIVVTISIHALREEGDDFSRRGLYTCTNFYPRPPRGGRPAARCLPEKFFTFLSTPSARRATVSGCAFGVQVEISIHALREEGDQTPSA